MVYKAYLDMKDEMLRLQARLLASFFTYQNAPPARTAAASSSVLIITVLTGVV